MAAGKKELLFIGEIPMVSLARDRTCHGERSTRYGLTSWIVPGILRRPSRSEDQCTGILRIAK